MSWTYQSYPPLGYPASHVVNPPISSYSSLSNAVQDHPLASAPLHPLQVQAYQLPGSVGDVAGQYSRGSSSWIQGDLHVDSRAPPVSNYSALYGALQPPVPSSSTLKKAKSVKDFSCKPSRTSKSTRSSISEALHLDPVREYVSSSPSVLVSPCLNNGLWFVMKVSSSREAKKKATPQFSRSRTHPYIIQHNLPQPIRAEVQISSTPLIEEGRITFWNLLTHQEGVSLQDIETKTFCLDRAEDTVYDKRHSSMTAHYECPGYRHAPYSRLVRMCNRSRVTRLNLLENAGAMLLDFFGNHIKTHGKLRSGREEWDVKRLRTGRLMVIGFVLIGGSDWMLEAKLV
ncbi:hypothetical protein JAAARDRAFT_210949 [Jaapia argillacea MUCL 33604]|uniref:Uncharacterized protein n=1 Tax=Jaapia argillacea MUCL 33604 TaxID=933084 RepID=A0A067PKS4_9AGAM|nr:hypothetical protein JAAARDRAFT_210949 [Jaapia argillacea MUCL 33604]